MEVREAEWAIVVTTHSRHPRFYSRVDFRTDLLVKASDV
jgi:hypothetical protein